MGQKVNPVGMRFGLNKDWNSRWFASKEDYSNYLIEDIKIREFLEKKIGKDALLSHIEIERKKNDKGTSIRVYPFVAKVGIVVGQDAQNIKQLTEELSKILGKGKDVKIDVIGVKAPNLDAKIVSLIICNRLEQRTSFRIVQKKAIADVKKAGALGVKTEVSGRLAGADIARSEGYKDGTMAINTLRSDIDYACSEAMTTYGKLGVKVWICRGEITEKGLVSDMPSEDEKKFKNNSSKRGK